MSKVSIFLVLLGTVSCGFTTERAPADTKPLIILLMIINTASFIYKTMFSTSPTKICTTSEGLTMSTSGDNLNPVPNPLTEQINSMTQETAKPLNLELIDLIIPENGKNTLFSLISEYFLKLYKIIFETIVLSFSAFLIFIQSPLEIIQALLSSLANNILLYFSLLIKYIGSLYSYIYELVDWLSKIANSLLSLNLFSLEKIFILLTIIFIGITVCASLRLIRKIYKELNEKDSSRKEGSLKKTVNWTIKSTDI